MDSGQKIFPTFKFSKFYQFDEITLYFINLTLVFLFLADPLMRSDFFGFFTENGRDIAILLFCAYGFLGVFRMVVSPEKNDKYKGVAGLLNIYSRYSIFFLP